MRAWFVFFLFVFSSVSQAETEAELRQRFVDYFGLEALRSEQDLVAKQPTQFDNRFQRIARLLSPNYTRTGSLEDLYKPASGRVFEIPALLIPAEEVPQNMIGDHHADLTSSFYETIDGKKYFRFFIHPADVGSYEKEIAKYRRDPKKWYATPSSSNRSVLVIDPTTDKPGLVLKLSLHQKMAGADRSITEKQTVRAVGISAAVEEAHTHTGGKLPSGMSWHYFPEFLSALPPGRDEGGYIARALPRDVDPAKKDVIPLFALIAGPRDEGRERWFDELFRKSGYKSKKDFLWDKVLKPSVELYETLALDHGVVPELHKQNMGLVVDKATGKIDGVYVRDMDGMKLDHSLRKQLGLATPPVPTWTKERDAYEGEIGQLAQSFFFYYMQTMNFEQLTKATLDGESAYELMERTSKSYLAGVNRRFGTRLRTLGDLSRFWDGFHKKYATAEENAKIPNSHRMGVRVAGYGRHAEMLVDRVVAYCRENFRVF